MNGDMRLWKPVEHLERAQVLMSRFDAKWDADGEWQGKGAYTTTPPALTLAGLHLKVAEIKMMGKGRA